MKPRSGSSAQSSFLLQELSEQLDPRQPLYKLSGSLPWQIFEEAFAGLYSDQGRPAKPVRLMVGLLLLKQLENLSDEAVVERWVQNPYYQFFCGMRQFQWELPCDPTDLVYFRKRIGEEGVQLVLAVTARMHGSKAEESEVVVDTTVQEKNITHPTDSKLYSRIIRRCWKLADEQGIKLRRRYGKEVKRCVMAQRWRRKPGQQKTARKALKKLRTLAGRLVRELERKLGTEVLEKQKEHFALYHRVLKQKKQDANKVYSLHEPQTYCMAKGKENKKYEFGSKASVVMTRTHGVIVGAVAHEKNVYDGHTLPEVLEVTESIMGTRPLKAIADRGYRGEKEVNGTQILTPQPGGRDQSRREKEAMRKRFRRRAAIEPVISHLKHDHRLMRNYLKGSVGDAINLLLAAAAWNLRKWMRSLLFCLIRLCNQLFPQPMISPQPA